MLTVGWVISAEWWWRCLRIHCNDWLSGDIHVPGNHCHQQRGSGGYYGNCHAVDYSGYGDEAARGGECFRLRGSKSLDLFRIMSHCLSFLEHLVDLWLEITGIPPSDSSMIQYTWLDGSCKNTIRLSSYETSVNPKYHASHTKPVQAHTDSQLPSPTLHQRRIPQQGGKRPAVPVTQRPLGPRQTPNRRLGLERGGQRVHSLFALARPRGRQLLVGALAVLGSQVDGLVPKSLCGIGCLDGRLGCFVDLGPQPEVVVEPWLLGEESVQRV